MLTVWSSKDRDLSFGVMRGTFNRDQVIQELKRAYRDGDLVPGWDRAWLIDLDHPADAIPVSDLWTIQKRVADLEEQGNGQKRTPDFKSVFIAPPVLCALTFEMYVLLWELDDRLKPLFFHVESFTAAEAILGCSKLQLEFVDTV